MSSFGKNLLNAIGSPNTREPTRSNNTTSPENPALIDPNTR